MNNFSPNMLKTFEDCPKKYDFRYLQKISIPQKISFFEKGKKIHALANYYLRGADLSQLESVLTYEEKVVWSSLKSNEYFQKTYVNSECNLSAKVGECWIGGRLDALMKSESANKNTSEIVDKNGYVHEIGHENVNGNLHENMNGKRHENEYEKRHDYFILDYKTGSIPKTPENDPQTIVYLLCADKFIKNYNSLKFVYIDLKNNTSCVVDFDKNLKSHYEQTITNLCKQVTTTVNFENIEHSQKCEYCEYQKICF